jgi:glycine/D-amino acid oxidase-like deaminating enzyme
MPVFISAPQAHQLPTQADVIIIGGGLAGTAALWALHRLDPNLSLVLIESNAQLASGSSTASLENFRTCWATACIAQQMKRSVEVFFNADEYLGEGAQQAIHVKQRGYLFCGFNDKQAQILKTDVAQLHNVGMTHIEYLEGDEVQKRFGWVGKKVVAVKYDATAGWLDSYALVTHYAKSVPNAQILLDVKDTCLVVESGKIMGVQTDNGFIASHRVLIANGANANLTAKTANLRLPIVIRPRQSFTSDFRHAEFPEDAPMIIANSPFAHVRPEAGKSAIFGWEYAWRTKGLSEEYGINHEKDALIYPIENKEHLKDPRFPSIMLTILARQFGHADGEGFADSRYLRGVRHNIGYYVYRDATTAYITLPDGMQQPYESERAILDEHPEVDGLFMSVAHSGHGIMSSPAAGEIIAHRILGKKLPHPLYEQFSIATKWVEHDANGL